MGNVIPKWFDNQLEGSTTTIKLPPHWPNDKFFGFATCAALELGDNCFLFNHYLVMLAKLRFKTNHGEKSLEDVCFGFEVEFGNTSSDHVFMGYQYAAATMFHDTNINAFEATV